MEAEMLELFKDLPEAINNTVAIAKRCSYLSDKVQPLLPIFECPNGKTQDEFIDEEARKGLAQRMKDHVYFEGMTAGLHAFKKTVDAFDAELKSLLSDYHLLSNEGCGRCETCTYPSAPCRFPSKLHPSLEGYGFVVSELAKNAGIRYINGADTVTYFSALLF